MSVWQQTRNIINYPENAFIGTHKEVLALAAIENVTVRWSELKDKKLYLCSSVIASMFQLSSKKKKKYIYIYMKRTKYQFISNFLARVCGLITLPTGKTWQKLFLSLFQWLLFLPCWQKHILNLPMQAPQNISNQLFLRFDKLFSVNKMSNKFTLEVLGITCEHVVLENFSLWETFSELSGIYVSRLLLLWCPSLSLGSYL